MAQTEQERIQYEAREKAARDEIWKRNWAARQRDEGWEKGPQEGRQVGLKEGLQEGLEEEKDCKRADRKNDERHNAG